MHDGDKQSGAVERDKPKSTNPAKSGAPGSCLVGGIPYPLTMSVKEQLLEAVQNLPANATWEDAAEQLRFLQAIDTGMQQAEAGRAMPHEQVKAELEQWLL
ncbi:MAG TPA: hypothetical protein VHC95_05640 [Opitutales bacterium]|nr:hypothetical protein [Opitutales bacterium]